MLIVMGFLRVDPSDKEAFMADVAVLARGTLSRAGCLFYAAAVDDSSVARVLIAERWESQDALNAHLASPEVTAFVRIWGDRMQGDIRKFDGANERPLAEAPAP